MTRATSVILSVFLSTSLAAAVITSSAGSRVRFTAPGPTAQIRVQILVGNGVALFDSAWKNGNVLEWRPGSLADGSYLCVVMVKDLEGNVVQKESSLTAREGEIVIDPAEGQEILLLHDGSNGEIVTTSGDLKFSFGDFLTGKEKERMRLTANGDLQIDGTIRASKGIVLPDGTIVASAEAVVARAPQLRAISPPAASSQRLTPRPTVTPAFQFVVNDTGVLVGTTNPAFRLDVKGEINTATQYDIGGSRFAHNYGTLNTFVGSGAGNFTTTGSNNTAMGLGVLNANTTGTANTGLGGSTLFSNTTGYDNLAAGTSALYANVDGYGNTAVGRSALFNNTQGQNNTATGVRALQSTTTGTDNTAMGRDALFSNSNGFYNTAVGSQALIGNTIGSNNVALGGFALANTTANSNTACGFDALLFNTTGSHNIGIGENGGRNLSTGDYNIDIGNSGAGGEAATIRIGDSNHTRTFVAGIYGSTTGFGDAAYVLVDSRGQLATNNSSRRFKFDINDMNTITDDLLKLRPVTFRYLAQGDGAQLQYGLIAEEVEKVYPEMVTHDREGQVQSVMYQFLAPMLLNEVQKQHREIEQQRSTIDALTRRLEALESRLAKN